jgi:hypothetical protein
MRFETFNQYIHSFKHVEYDALMIANSLIKGGAMGLEIILNQLNQPLPLFFIVHPLSLRSMSATAKMQAGHRGCPTPAFVTRWKMSVSFFNEASQST